MTQHHSCIYRGMIRHRRRTAVTNAFKFPAYMMYVDLEELEPLLSRRLFWSASRPAPARFKREDHLKEQGSEVSLREAAIERNRSHPFADSVSPFWL